MAYSLDGRFTARLNGPLKGGEKNKFYQLYQEYLECYEEFESLASTFRRDTIPVKRLMSDGTTEYAVPLYCSPDNADPKSQIEQEKGEKAAKLQKYTLERWEQLLEMVKKLCKNDYVHHVSPYSRIIMDDGVDVTSDPYVRGRCVEGVEVERSERTNQEYERLLMCVVYQNQ